MCRTYGAENFYGQCSQPFRAGLHSAAPPALGLGGYRFGYAGRVARLRNGDWWFVGAIGESQLSAGGTKDCSPARKGWVHGKLSFRAP
jgi:hypothetical protein